MLYPTHLTQPAGQQGHQAIRVVTIRNGEDPTTLGMTMDVDESQELSFPALCLAKVLPNQGIRGIYAILVGKFSA